MHRICLQKTTKWVRKEINEDLKMERHPVHGLRNSTLKTGQLTSNWPVDLTQHQSKS